MRRSPTLVIVLLLLASCTSVPPLVPAAPASLPPPARIPAPTSSPMPSPTPAPAPLSADWRDWPLTPGNWDYRQDARGSIALFGRAGADAELTLRCDLARRMLYLSRRGAGEPAAAMTIVVRTTEAQRTLAGQPTGGAYVAVALAPNDAVVDAMGFSRGRFLVESPSLPTLVVPAWAEILRVAEDCR